MKLIALTLKNFMPYKDAHKILFPTDSRKNVVLIFGDNMRGKTSLLNAIRWVFYGKAWGRQLRLIERKNIVNWDAAGIGDWDVEVSVQFESNGDRYDLRRIMKPIELIVNPKKDEDFEIILGLKKNGIVIASDKIDHELNQLIPEQISRFFLFDSELLQEYEMLLIQKSEQGRQIKEAIEKVLGVPALINARNELRTLLKKARSNQIKETKRIERLSAFSKEQEKLSAELEALEKDKKKLEIQQEEYNKKISELEDELSETSGIMKYKSKLDSLRELRKTLLRQDQELRELKLKCIVDAWKDMLQPRIQAKIKELEKLRDFFKSKVERKGELKGYINIYRELLDKSVCPICKRQADENIREMAGTKLGIIEGELESMSHGSVRLAEVTSDIAKLKKIRFSGTRERIQRIDRELNEISIKLVEVESEIVEIQEKVKDYDTAEVARKRALKEQYIKELGNLSGRIQKVTSDIEENNRKQNQLAMLISRDPEAKYKKTSIQVDIISSLEQIFSEGIDILRDELRSKVSDLATDAFKQLITEKTYLRLDVNENYGLSIVDRHGRNVPERSAGAEQIVALALIDALNKVARKTGPIVMDTPLGRLDPKHRKNLISYIPNLAEQVIMLVHEGEMSKTEILDSMKTRIGAMYEIERISSSQSRIIKI